jgi:hypothetical protein
MTISRLLDTITLKLSNMLGTQTKGNERKLAALEWHSPGSNDVTGLAD